MTHTTIELGILLPAFVAGLLVAATHAPLGIQVLNRGIVFIDLAIAQVAGLGVIFADWLGLEPQGWGVQAAALAAALTGALFLTWTERRWPEVQEAVIGTTFVLGASGALLLLAANPHGAEHLKDLLVGQILWVNWPRLLPVTLVYALILALWFGMGERIGRIGFYLLFAAAVTLSVQLVGALPRVRIPHRAGARDSQIGACASRDLLRFERLRLRSRVTCLRGVRPAIGSGDRLGNGVAGGPGFRLWRAPVRPAVKFFRVRGRSNMAFPRFRIAAHRDGFAY